VRTSATPRGAIASYEKALALRRTLAARRPTDARDLERLAFLLSQMGRFFSGTGDWDRAEESAREAIALLEECQRSGAIEEDLRGRLAASGHTLGWVLLRKADAKGAHDALERAVSEARDFAAAHPESSDARASLANIQTDFSESLHLVGRLEESASVSHEARVILSELLEAEPENPRYTRGVIVALSYEADALEALEKFREAVEIRERAVEVSRGFLASDERNAGALLGVAITARKLGTALFLTGDAQGALARLRESVEAGERALASSGTALAVNQLASDYAQWAEVLSGSGAPATETCVPLKKALEIWDELKTEGRFPPDVEPDYQRLRSLPVTCPPA
jgi:tetratricopeptide (TPR) repeat protein